MITLAIDLSSTEGSIALFRDGKCLGQSAWLQNRRDGQALFREWPILLQQHDCVPADIGRYVVGRGPGRFSGLRVSLASAQAAALATDADVYAVSSGEALAASIPGAEAVAVIGDARRDKLWLGLFVREADGCIILSDGWQLIDPGELPVAAASATSWVSPQWTRMQTLLPAELAAHPSWISEERLPSARMLGETAIRRIARGIPSEPFTPLYLHPPVQSH